MSYESFSHFAYGVLLKSVDSDLRDKIYDMEGAFDCEIIGLGSCHDNDTPILISPKAEIVGLYSEKPYVEIKHSDLTIPKDADEKLEKFFNELGYTPKSKPKWYFGISMS